MDNLEKRPDNAVGQVYDYSTHAGRGFDNQTKDDVAMPFLALLQGGEKNVTDVDNPAPGRILNTILRTAHDSVPFVAAITEHCIVEWIPRLAGGGVAGTHRLDSPLVVEARAKAKELNLPFGVLGTAYNARGEVTGNDLKETFYVYGVQCDEEGQVLCPAVLGFASTKIKVYKAFNTRLNMFQVPGVAGEKITPPLYAHLLRIESRDDKNAKGEFKNYVVRSANKDSFMESLLAPTDPRFLAAAEVRTLIMAGRGRVDYSNVPQGGGADEDKTGI